MTTVLTDFNNIVVTILQTKGMIEKLSIGDYSLPAQTILENIKKFVGEQTSNTNETILCVDSKSWRKLLPFDYKANRDKKKQEEKDKMKMIYGFIEPFINDIITHNLFPVIKVNYAEADDSLAVLSKYIVSNGGKVIVYSGDIDMAVLHDGINIDVYRRGWVRYPLLYKSDGVHFQDPTHQKMYQILRGQDKDGIPKIIEEKIVTGSRVKGLGPKGTIEVLNEPERVQEYINKFPENYKRNKLLTDFDMIPNSIQQAIVEHYNTRVVGQNRDWEGFFEKYNLHSLMPMAQIYRMILK